MTHYQESIIAVTGCTAQDVAEVEDYMRNIVLHGASLSGLSRAQFNRAARTAWMDIQWTRTPEGIEYLKKLEEQYA